MMQRFKLELILVRDETHHNVIRLYEIGEADGVDFITMEFVEREYLSVENVYNLCCNLEGAPSGRAP